MVPPEERVRISLVKFMVQKLGYPRELIALEKEMALLPYLAHLPKKSIPKRRIDVLVFSHLKGSMFPLLMIECKAVPIHIKETQQLISYNTFVQAPFIAVVNEAQSLFAKANEKEVLFQEGFMFYRDLCEAVSDK